MWSTSELVLGLKAVEVAEQDPDLGFDPGLPDREEAMGLLQELVRRGWAKVDAELKANGRLVSAHGARLTRTGRRELSAFQAAEARLDDSHPVSAHQAWTSLRAYAPRYSPLERAIAEAELDLRTRGIYDSGPSVVRAMELAYDNGLEWTSVDGGRFVQTPEASASSTTGSESMDPDVRKVFVVYGRDDDANDALFGFLRALGLVPLEWEAVVAMTGTAAPYVGDVVVRGFKEAQAAVVLFTPDDEVRLHRDLLGAAEPAYEREMTCQPRPNVLIEAGMALALHQDRTCLVQIGNVRPASDLVGRHVLRLGTPGSLLALAKRLHTAGCPVDLTTSEITKETRFTKLAAQGRQSRGSPESEEDGELPRGTVVDLPKVEPASAELSARLHRRGRSDYLLEIRNRGGVPLSEVQLDLPEEAGWNVLWQVLPEYPIMRIDPRQHVRVPVSVHLGSKAVVRGRLLAKNPGGSDYETTVQMSLYD